MILNGLPKAKSNLLFYFLSFDDQTQTVVWTHIAEQQIYLNCNFNQTKMCTKLKRIAQKV